MQYGSNDMLPTSLILMDKYVHHHHAQMSDQFSRSYNDGLLLPSYELTTSSSTNCQTC